VFLLAVGVAAYLLGWIYLPDSSLFQNWIKKGEDANEANASRQQAQAFLARRDALLRSLSLDKTRRYYEIAEVCKDIERVSRDAANSTEQTDPRLRKLDELMWTFLRLLALETSLEQFLASEGKEDILQSIATNKAEIDQLDSEIKDAVAKGEAPTYKMRLMDSRKERLAALTKRQERVTEASDNLRLVRAEQDRLVDQIKLLRADSVAAKNAETLSARIDATVENLSQTNKLFAEMDQFKDLVSEDMPQTSERLGYAPSEPALDGFRVNDQRSSAAPPVIRVRPTTWTRR
jgi:hypothetical protein